MKSANGCCIPRLHRDGTTCLKIIGILTVLLAVPRLWAATNTWLPLSGTNDWFVGTNWSGGSVPTNGDEVIINPGTTTNWVMLTNSTYALASILLTNKCTLIFSNWDTALSATNVSILTNSTMTCFGPFGTNAMSNRVYIVCSNLTIAAGGMINVNGVGWESAQGPGRGPGLPEIGGSVRGGGGYGGRGGYGQYMPNNDNFGRPYGDVSAPVDPGSGGGTSGGNAGAGGGVVYVNASSGRVTVNGIVSANGGDQPGTLMGGGSGGAIYIICQTFAGTNGILRARGGAGSVSSSGGGGGGRVAVVYDVALQSNQAIPQVSFLANGGTGYDSGDIGTLYFPSASVMTNLLTANQVGSFYGFSSWAADSLTVSGAWVRFAGESFTLTVASDATINGANSRLDIGGGGVWPVYQSGRRNLYRYSTQTNGSSITIGGDLLLTNSGQLYVYSGLTNNLGGDYGALINVTSAIILHTNTWIYCISHPTNGVSVLLRMKNITIATNAGINADSVGYGNAQGPGKGSSSIRPGGGGYGGAGGSGADGTPGGGTYGDSNAPMQSGSGGGNYSGTLRGEFGGGLVRIQAEEIVSLNGTISADAKKLTNGGGGGAGGGVNIRCRTFTGSNGIVRANGASVDTNYYGGGGGGRIAIWRMYDSSVGSTTTADYGTGYSNGVSGTVVWIQIPVPGTIMTFH